MNEQGVNAQKLFYGQMEGQAVELFYSESAELFANTISKIMAPGSYSLIDLGGHKGELFSEVKEKLPDYHFKAIIADKVDGIDPNLGAEKIVTDVTHTPFENKSADIVIVRYVLAWNTPENQKEILKEISRITKGIAIIQHQGADSDNPALLSEAQSKLFSGDIPELKRDLNYSWTDPRTLETWMNELGIKYSTIQDRRIDGLSDLFIEKYGLTDQKADSVKEMLHNYDYVMQTTWVLDFRS